MAKIDFSGLDEYADFLSQVGLELEREIMGEAIYKGASVVFEEINKGISSIPTDETWGTREHPQFGLNRLQKAGLHESLGIARMRNDDGFLNVKIGFDGYNKIKTERWPNGQPNAMVARSIERGTSWLKATPFVKKSIAAVKQRVLGVMMVVFEEKIHAIAERK